MCMFVSVCVSVVCVCARGCVCACVRVGWDGYVRLFEHPQPGSVTLQCYDATRLCCYGNPLKRWAQIWASDEIRKEGKN